RSIASDFISSIRGYTDMAGNRGASPFVPRPRCWDDVSARRNDARPIMSDPSCRSGREKA
ncbi:hypothetical protein ACLOJK_000191, partial [Asimina triloba]